MLSLGFQLIFLAFYLAYLVSYSEFWLYTAEELEKGSKNRAKCPTEKKV